jgi:uncharacterized protein (TIGR00288 family)
LNEDARVAVMVDCDNVSPDILEHAPQMAAQFGRVVLRRGYGNPEALSNKWQEALVQWAFTPCLQFRYSAGKNTSDIALALDAMEALFDQRAEVFCLVTSDSDFAYLCRKLRERGASVCIVGEAKTPRTAQCQRSVLRVAKPKPQPPEPPAAECTKAPEKPAGDMGVAPAAKPLPKHRPRFVLDAVKLLVSEASEGKVGLGALGQYLKRTNPAFTPNQYGHAGLLQMLKSYEQQLSLKQEPNGGWSVSLKTATTAD